MVHKLRTSVLVVFVALTVLAGFGPVIDYVNDTSSVAYAQSEPQPEPEPSAQQAPQDPADNDVVPADPEASNSSDIVDFSGNCRQQVGILSWIFCPILNLIAEGVEKFATWIIENFLYTEPVIVSAVDQDARSRFLFDAWGAFRNLANIFLVVAFMIIIYLQLTSSNFTAQRMLPRLVVATIMIQFSFPIAALIIDAGNVLAAGINGIFSSINESLPNVEQVRTTYVEGNPLAETLVDDNQWLGTSLGMAILLALLPIAGIAAVGFVLGGSGLILMVMTLGVSILLFFALLAIRQLAIVAFVVLAPFAFLAAVFPQTERITREWFDNLIKIILIYPIVIFIVSIASTLSLLSLATDAEGFSQFMAAALPIVAFLMSPFAFKFAGRLFGNLVNLIQQGTRQAQHGALGDKNNPNSWRNRLKEDKNRNYMDTADKASSWQVAGRTPLGYTRRFTRPTWKAAGVYGQADSVIKSLFSPVFPERLHRFMWGPDGFASAHGTKDWQGMDSATGKNFDREFGQLYKAGKYYAQLHEMAAQESGMGPDKAINYTFANARNAIEGRVREDDAAEFYQGFQKLTKGQHLYLDAMGWDGVSGAVGHRAVTGADDLMNYMYNDSLGQISDPELQQIATKTRTEYAERLANNLDERQSGNTYKYAARVLSDSPSLQTIAQTPGGIDHLRSIKTKAESMSRFLGENLNPEQLKKLEEGQADDEHLMVGGHGRNGGDIRKMMDFVRATQTREFNDIIGDDSQNSS